MERKNRSPRGGWIDDLPIHLTLGTYMGPNVRWVWFRLLTAVTSTQTLGSRTGREVAAPARTLENRLGAREVELA